MKLQNKLNKAGNPGESEFIVRLPLEFIYDKFNYKQILRSDSVAIYEQSKWGKIRGYEVIIIGRAKKRTVFDRSYPRKEKYPKSEDWGQKAWTCSTWERALERFNGLNDQEEGI
jgi:hypothetical protein